MSKASGLYVGNKKVYQEIDVEQLLGIDLSNNPFLAQAIGQEIVDHMRERSKSGKDIFGNNFAPYSKSYKKSEEFTAYGKSSKVDMTLTDSMLSSLDFEANGNTLRFEFDDSEEEIKAFGHMSGMQGHPNRSGKAEGDPNGGFKQRQFFGITDADFKELVGRKFKDELDQIRSAQDQEGDDAIFNLPGNRVNPTGGAGVTLGDLLGGSLFDEDF